MRVIVAAIALLLPIAVQAEDVDKPIRQFDLATIEKLGRAIYRQDQEAWHATDMLHERFDRDDLIKRGLRGWIVDELADRDVVRFVRVADSGPEIFYDVTYPKDGQPVLSEPAEHGLTAEERAKFDARTLALAQLRQSCFESFNTVVLKDPERDGWLVWALAATTKPDVIVIGGHVRFSVSPDGKTIVQTDKLSHGCLALPKPKPREGQSGSLVTGQFVANIPVETYVFASLSYHEVLRVGTPDGRAWKVDGDTITAIDMDMPDIDGFAARAMIGQDEECRSIVKGTIDGQTKYFVDAAAKVIQSTEQADNYPAQTSSRGEIVSITCGRDDIVPAPNDYKVLLAGYTLYIVDRGAGHPKRMGLLEISDGRVRFRLTQGTLDDDLAKRVGPRLDAMEKAIHNRTGQSPPGHE